MNEISQLAVCFLSPLPTSLNLTLPYKLSACNNAVQLKSHYVSLLPAYVRSKSEIHSMQRFSQTKSNQFSGLTVCHSHNITIWKSQWGSLLSIISACSSQDFLCNVWTVPFPWTVSLPHLCHLEKSYSHFTACLSWSIFKTQSHSKVHMTLDHFKRAHFQIFSSHISSFLKLFLEHTLVLLFYQHLCPMLSPLPFSTLKILQ